MEQLGHGAKRAQTVPSAQVEANGRPLSAVCWLGGRSLAQHDVGANLEPSESLESLLEPSKAIWKLYSRIPGRWQAAAQPADSRAITRNGNRQTASVRHGDPKRRPPSGRPHLEHNSRASGPDFHSSRGRPPERQSLAGR